MNLNDSNDVDDVIVKGHLATVYKSLRYSVVGRPLSFTANDHTRASIRDTFQSACNLIVRCGDAYQARPICDLTNNTVTCVEHNHVHVSVDYVLKGDAAGTVRRMVFNFPPNDCPHGGFE